MIIVINVLVSALTTRFPSMNFDLTKEGLNTLSDEATDVAKEIVNETTIYIIGSEDAIRGDEVYSNYSLKYSQVANLADRLHELNDKIKVEYIDPDMNPQFISDYADDSLTTGKVMVKTDKRHKTLAVTDLFSIQQDSSTGQYNYYSKVDGALANALYLVNLDTVPVVAFATGHNEMLTVSDNLSTFTGMLNDNNFEVKEFNMLTDEIPEDASIVVLGTPTTDYTSEELSKLEAYLGDEKMASSRTLYVTAYPTQSWADMPNLKSFLAEWGLEPQTGVLFESDMNNVLTTQDASPAYLFANVTDKVLSGTYDNVIAAAAAPVKRLFTANNDISTYSILETSDTAYLTTTQEVEENPNTDTYTITGLAQRYMDNQGKICANVVVLTATPWATSAPSSATPPSAIRTIRWTSLRTSPARPIPAWASLSTRPRRTHLISALPPRSSRPSVLACSPLWCRLPSLSSALSSSSEEDICKSKKGTCFP